MCSATRFAKFQMLLSKRVPFYGFHTIPCFAVSPFLDLIETILGCFYFTCPRALCIISMHSLLSDALMYLNSENVLCAQLCLLLSIVFKVNIFFLDNLYSISFCKYKTISFPFLGSFHLNKKKPINSENFYYWLASTDCFSTCLFHSTVESSLNTLQLSCLTHYLPLMHNSVTRRHATIPKIISRNSKIWKSIPEIFKIQKINTENANI